MKRLILVRHGKSDWGNMNLNDFDRPLSDRGNTEVKFVSKILKRLDIKSDLILSSSSKRTTETLEGIWEFLDAENDKIIYEKGIYDNHMSENLDYYISLLGKIDDNTDRVVLVGHNNFITSLLRFTTGNDNLIMETLGVAIIDFDIKQWVKINNHKGNLVFFLSPKYLMD